jgi:hypothetical protein
MASPSAQREGLFEIVLAVDMPAEVPQRVHQSIAIVVQ